MMSLVEQYDCIWKNCCHHCCLYQLCWRKWNAISLSCLIKYAKIYLPFRFCLTSLLAAEFWNDCRLVRKAGILERSLYMWILCQSFEHVTLTLEKWMFKWYFVFFYPYMNQLVLYDYNSYLEFLRSMVRKAIGPFRCSLACSSNMHLSISMRNQWEQNYQMSNRIYIYMYV